MFTGFFTENTPAVKVWNLNIAPPTSGAYTPINTIALTDDCAPIQILRIGETTANVTNSVYLYLPTSPIEGKQIKIVAQLYGSQLTDNTVFIFGSDAKAGGSSLVLYQMSSGQTIDLIYSKEYLNFPGGGGYSTGWVSINQSPISAQNYNAVAFGSASRATGTNSFAVGSGATASGSDSVALGSNNTASGGNSTAFGQYSSAGGGYGFTAGYFQNSSGYQSACLGGMNNTASGTISALVGGGYGTTRSITCSVSTANQSAANYTAGAFQTSYFVFAKSSTNDATATVLTTNNGAASGTNQVILPNNANYYYSGKVVAGVTGGGNTKAWTFEGVIKRGANAAATSLVGTPPINIVAADSGASTWTVGLTADTTNGGLTITITGGLATTIRWAAKVETVEIAI
jgi:hypothetical protein